MTCNAPRLALAAVFALALAGCDGPVAEEPAPQVDTSTWETVARRIFVPACAGACHSAGTAFARQSDLVLTEDVAYRQLVDVPPANEAAAADGLLRVSSEGPVGLEKSFLWEKINAPNEDHFYEDHPHYGALMPLGAPPLTYGELEYIRQWIYAGAPETGEVADRALLADTARYSPTAFEALAAPSNGRAFRLGPFDVPPRNEREFFVYEPLDLTADVFIDRVEMTMRPGSHHFLLYTFDESIPPGLVPAPGQIRDLRTETGQPLLQNYQPMLYHVFFAGTQWPRMNYHFPPGVALRLEAGTGLDLNSHYVNRGAAPMQGEVHVNLHYADPAEVRYTAQVLSLNNFDINLPPGRVTTLREDFFFSERHHIFQLFSHAHEHMVEFRVEILGGPRSGELIYVATDWEHPPILELNPPLTLEAGQGLRLIVTYDNQTNRTLRFGLLSEDEMMILFGYYYTD